MAETLKQVLDRILSEKKLTHKEFTEAVGLGMSTFRKWRTDPDSASDETLKSIRAFTERPGKFLKGATKATPLKKKSAAPMTELAQARMSLKKLKSLSSSDWVRINGVMEVLNVSSVTVEQLLALVDVLRKRPSKG